MEEWHEDGSMESSLSDLPPELLLQIFEFLPLKDVLNLKFVCNDWAWLTAYSCLYREVSVTSDVPLEDLLKILSKYTNDVEIVTLAGRQDTNIILQALSKCPKLRRLNMINCSGTRTDSISTSRLVNVFRKTNLSEFSIEHCTCFVHVLSILPPEPCSRKMVRFSSNATNSTSQNLHFLGRHFFLMLETSADSLTYLSIVDANINFITTDFATLFRLIGNCRKLKELSYHVSYLPISDDNFRQLYNLNCLVSLSLRSLRRLSSEALENFFQPNRTGRMKKLELFDIGLLSVTTLKRIGHGCPNLESLALYQSTGSRVALITRDLVEELVHSFTQLRRLMLSYVDESGIDVVTLLAEKLTHLKLLEFEVSTCDDFVFKLKSTLSECLTRFDVKSSRFGRITCQLKSKI